MNSTLYREVEEQLEQLRRRNIAVRDERKLELYNKYPQLSELDMQLRGQISALYKAKQSGNESVKEIENRIIEFKTQIALFIKENNIDEDIFVIKYNCSFCNDTGIIEKDGIAQKCACFKQKLLEATYKENQCEGAKDQTFEAFAINLFSEQPIDANGNSIRSNMQKILNYCEKFADAFPNNQRNNILLTGKTGVGKTYLLNCINARVLQNGNNALIISSGRLFDILRSYAFSQTNSFEDLLKVDLLLIDDLGTEPMFNNTTVEYLFLLINERTKMGKHLVLTTNLTTEQLNERYTQRIVSRLMDRSSSIVLNIAGEDLRLKKR